MRPRWRKLSLASSPPSRSGAGFTYLPDVGSVLFGGAVCAWSCKPAQDLWRYDDSGWTQLTAVVETGLLPVVYPAFSALGGTTNVRLFGGFTGLGQSDRELVYFTSGSSWSRLNASPSLVARDSARMVWDTNEDRLLLFGGEGASGLVGSTFTAQGAQAFQKTSDLVEPPARRDHAMVYDARSERVLLFGGRACTRLQSCEPLGDLWAYQSTTGWVELTTSGPRPSARFGHSLSFDEARGVTILFGGRSEDAVLDDTWELHDDAWSALLQGALHPSARAHAAMTYDASRQVTVLFGGQQNLVLPESTNDHLGDTWEYGLVDLRCTSSADCDTGHCVDGVCCTTASCGSCESCATPGSLGSCAPIDGPDPDSCATSCADGFCLLPAGSTCESEAACESGFCAGGVCCDAACEGPCEACKSGKCEPLSADTEGSCEEGLRCDGVHAECVPPEPPKLPSCASASDCSSGICIGGRCCDSLYDCGTECSEDGRAEINLLTKASTPCEYGCFSGRCALEPVDCRMPGGPVCPEGTACAPSGDCVNVRPTSGPRFEASGSAGFGCTATGRGVGGKTGALLAFSLVGVVAWRRRLRRSGIVGLLLGAFILGGCTVYDVEDGEPCRQAGYSIASRLYTCTGDEARANEAYEQFHARYVCHGPAKRAESYACAVQLNRRSCEEAADLGADPDRWVASSSDCLALLSGIVTPNDDCRPLAEVIAPKIAACTVPRASFVAVLADALGELSHRRCVVSDTPYTLEACRGHVERASCDEVSPAESALAWATQTDFCNQLLEAP